MKGIPKKLSTFTVLSHIRKALWRVIYLWPRLLALATKSADTLLMTDSGNTSHQGHLGRPTEIWLTPWIRGPESHMMTAYGAVRNGVIRWQQVPGGLRCLSPNSFRDCTWMAFLGSRRWLSRCQYSNKAVCDERRSEGARPGTIYAGKGQVQKVGRPKSWDLDNRMVRPKF